MLADFSSLTNLPFLRITILIVASYGLLCLFAAYFSDGMIFPKPPPSYDKKEADLYLQTASGESIACIHLKNEQSENPVTILFSHGNGEDIGHCREYLESLRDLGFSIFAYDYPGYGRSSGKPTEKGCHQSADVAYAYLLEQAKVKPEHIVVMGRSLGGGPSCELAANKKVGGLILETPFLTAFRVMTELPLLPWDKFRNISNADRISCPSLVIHGDMDQVVSFRHGKKLFEALPEPKSFLKIPNGEHNNVAAVGGNEYWESIKTFCQSLTKEDKP